jgi:phosphomevalonate kinase
MSYKSSATTAVSAPGKVLLTGGYLCLDRNYTGTVFALDARIHVVVEQLRKGHRRSESDTAENGTTGIDKDNEDSIVVRSPQFVGAVWEYGVQRTDNGGGIKVVQKNEGYDISISWIECG